MSEFKNLAAALAKVQGGMPSVHKGKTARAGSYSYDYADLADVMKAIGPLLAENGLAFACAPRVTEAGQVLDGILMHESGESLTGSLVIHGRLPQEVGSSLTYARRYLLGCLTGVVTDADDDGAMAQAAKPAKTSKRETRPPAAPVDPEKTEAGDLLAQMVKLMDSLEIPQSDRLAYANAVVRSNHVSATEFPLVELRKVIAHLVGEQFERDATAARDAKAASHA